MAVCAVHGTPSTYYGTVHTWVVHSILCTRYYIYVLPRQWVCGQNAKKAMTCCKWGSSVGCAKEDGQWGTRNMLMRSNCNCNCLSAGIVSCQGVKCSVWIRMLPLRSGPDIRLRLFSNHCFQAQGPQKKALREGGMLAGWQASKSLENIGLLIGKPSDTKESAITMYILCSSCPSHQHPPASKIPASRSAVFVSVSAHFQLCSPRLLTLAARKAYSITGRSRQDQDLGIPCYL